MISQRLNVYSWLTGSYGAKSGSHVRASFAGRENKAFSMEKTRASFTAHNSRANFQPRPDVSEEVKMRNLEVMAEYEGTRTYRSAVSFSHI